MSLEAHVTLSLGALALDVALDAPDGTTVAVLGPNGAGKTTLLRALAGLVPLEGGRVVLDGVTLEDPAQGTRVPTDQRPIGYVFQDHLLFPHLSVLDNVAFGLRARGVRRGPARSEARHHLARLGVEGLASARPRTLSGGQAQRVALARALATTPTLLLLDEPLAALDATAKAEVRRTLREVLPDFQGSRVLVTHDALDAFSLAQRVVIVEDGRVVQVGAPAQVAARPRSRYVAELMGVNLLAGNADGERVAVEAGFELVVGDVARGPVLVSVAPSAVALHRERPHGSTRNVWRTHVRGLETARDRVRVTLHTPSGLVAEVTTASFAGLDLDEGDPVWASLEATEITVEAT